MLLLNSHPDYRSPLSAMDIDTFGPSSINRVQSLLSQRKEYVPTRLAMLPNLASELNVTSIAIKDESERLGLGSFKALGGAYAVVRLALEAASKELGRSIEFSEINSARIKSIVSGITMCCATDGNHGRSVAQGAALVGAKCVIFVHSGVSEARSAAISKLGAQLVRVKGNYDTSVHEASRVANENGWIVVSDTSWPGYEKIPRLVMEGYTTLLLEARSQLVRRPTHIFVQAGVGGIAATVAAHFALQYGDERPFFVVVEPAAANCLYESAKIGHSVKIRDDRSTVMAMLECYEPSLMAWEILSRVADAFMTVDDDEAIIAMRRLARPLSGDPRIVAGESGGVGLAALIQIAKNEAFRKRVGLDSNSQVFLINTEGATDPELYTRLVGMPPYMAGDVEQGAP